MLTFVTVFLSLQYGDVASFFHFANSGTSDYSAFALKSAGIVFLGAAIFLRYWATLVDDSKLNYVTLGRFSVKYTSPELRYASLESLITGFVLMIIIVTLNLVQIIPIPLVENLLLFLVVLLLIGIGRIENKILQIYQTRDLIPKHSPLFAQKVFSSTGTLIAIMAVWLATVNVLIEQLKINSFVPIHSSFSHDLAIIQPVYSMLAASLLIIGAILCYRAVIKFNKLNEPTEEAKLNRKQKQLFKRLAIWES